MRLIAFLGLSTLLLALWAGFVTSALALEPREQRGLTFAKANCASCHAIGRTGASPLKIAPPFRTLHERYPVEMLA
ncbi:MAG: c-type cytochrome, partial [Hansschlegelia sp.]